MSDHHSYAHNLNTCESKAWKKKSGLNGIQTHDPCDTGAVLYQLSYQAVWQQATWWDRHIPIEGEVKKWIYEISCVFELQRMIHVRKLLWN